MSENTKIEWADHTFNPWEGCQKVGPGCDHCYAEARNVRFGGGIAQNWGPGAPRRRTAVANWRKPIKWNADAAAFAAANDGRRQRVFCASLADVFDNAVDPEWRKDLFALISATPNLDWLLLTKRIGNAYDMIKAARGLPDCWWYGQANVWIGATIVNQAEADRDIPKLMAVPAAKRFLSMEPLLGAVDLASAYLPCANAVDGLQMDMATGAHECCSGCDYTGIGTEMGIDWVIVGGESGPGARPIHPDWARDLRDQCQAASVPFLFKQWGEFMPPESNSTPYPNKDWRDVLDATGATRPVAFVGDPVLESSRQVVRVGKKAAGRLLDGREWNEVPA